MKKIEMSDLKSGDVIWEDGRLVVVLKIEEKLTFCHSDGDVMNSLTPEGSFNPEDLHLVTTLKELYEIARNIKDES